jgi:hypothetical protein
VKYLAGKAPAPPAPKVRLVEAARIEPLAGVAFDVERQAVWAISAVGPCWTLDEYTKYNGQKTAACLLRYSYPDFKLTGKWALPSIPSGRHTAEPLASPPILDLKNNQLYASVWYTTEWRTLLQREPGYSGNFHRFDLNKLPGYEPGAEPRRLKAAATHGDFVSAQWNVRGAVSPDGEWLYFTSRSSKPPAAGTGVFRLPTSLTGKAEEIFVSGNHVWGQPLWLSPDGKTLRLLQSGKVFPNSPEAKPGLLEINAGDWASLGVKELFDMKWNQIAPPQPVAIHPDGRVFVGTGAGVVETYHTAEGDAKRRVRPVPLPEDCSFLAVSGDGRFLFTSLGEDSVNRPLRPKPRHTRNTVRVLDVRANPAQLDELASLEETDKLRVGGPMFVSPDGQFVVFRSGAVVRVDDGSTIDRKRPAKPAPRDKPTSPAPLPAGALAPTDIKGLRFYLDCEQYDGAMLWEGVSKRLVGKLNQPMLIGGPRGNALRLTTVVPDRPNWRAPGLSIDPDLVRVGEGKPFTYAAWGRRVPDGSDAKADPYIILGEEVGKLRRHLGVTLARDRVYFQLGTGTDRALVWEETKTDEWVHVALARDERNEVRFYVNGKRVTTTAPVVFPDPMEYKTFRLASARTERAVVDADEFCAFDRALSAEEIGRLAKPGPQAARPKSPVEVAPMPRDFVPPATSFKGLRFYLDCDALEDDRVIEAVSKKSIGPIERAELIDGPRGKALRLFSAKKLSDDRRVGLSLDPGLLSVDAGKPFTYAMWTRQPGANIASGPPRLIDAGTPAKQFKDTSSTFTIDYVNTDIAFGLNRGREFATGSARRPTPEGWFHVAVTRDEKNEIRFYVNGEAVKLQKQYVFAESTRYAEFHIVRSLGGHYTLDVDEFCFFDRALGDEEMKKLAGRTGK